MALFITEGGHLPFKISVYKFGEIFLNYFPGDFFTSIFSFWNSQLFEYLTSRTSYLSFFPSFNCLALIFRDLFNFIPIFKKSFRFSKCSFLWHLVVFLRLLMVGFEGVFCLFLSFPK